MQRELLLKTSFYRAQRKRQKAWKKVVMGLASIVVFCTTYALILPAITMEPDYICGCESHIHDETCYQIPAPVTVTSLVCASSNTCVHTHTSECYNENSDLICGIADFVLHTHIDSCYDSNGALLCVLPEIQEHTHSETCFQQPHVHGDACYNQLQGDLLCLSEEGTIHTHVDACYTEKQNLICKLEEIAPHAHDNACYSQTKSLVCKVDECEGHTHGDSCKDENGDLSCQSPEIADHTHEDACYQITTTLICKTEETAGHAHAAECFDLVREVSCGLEADVAHTHGTACYAWTPVLNCTKLTAEDGAAPELSCKKAEIIRHTHTAECYDPSNTLICGLLEITEHVHSDTCFVVTQEQPTELVLKCGKEAHEHTASCVAQKETSDGALTGDSTLDAGTYCGLSQHQHVATCWGDDGNLMCTMTEHEHIWLCALDLPEQDTSVRETSDAWEAGLPELTYNIASDLIAVARSQLGYEQSEVNYLIGDEEILYYSRYADWWSYGSDPYGDWNAKFVAFCLDYAGITSVPLEPEISTWPFMLEYYDQWHENDGEFVPIPADLVFFDTDDDSAADRAGIITEADTVNGEFTAILERRGMVQQVTYTLSDSDILGYARIPGNEPAQVEAILTENAQNVIDLIEAMPSADEVDALAQAYDASESAEALASYVAAVEQVKSVHQAYSALSAEEQAAVTNADKLLALEYVWSAETLDTATIVSQAPTVGSYTSTKDFVELNLYDYNYFINDWWNANKNYPGFQWNGGAYSNQNDGYKNDYRYYYQYQGIGIPYAITDRYYVDCIDFGNSLITNHDYSGSDYGKSTSAINVGKLYDNSGASSTGKINWLWYDGSDYGSTTNRPVGFSTGYQSLSRTLVNGYPALSDGTTSLKYLFTNGSKYSSSSTAAVTKLNTTSIDGLFLQDETTGAYSFNSRENHAQLDTNDIDNDGIRDEFIRYNEIITPNFITYPFGNFLPLNKIQSSESTQVGAFNYAGGMKAYVNGIISDLTSWMNGSGITSSSFGYKARSQLKTMLLEYQENWGIYPSKNDTIWDTLSAANAIRDYFVGSKTSNLGDKPSADVSFITDAYMAKLYNIDWDVPTNFFFGMDMSMTFMQPKNGYTGKDTNGDGVSDYPMEFYFTGDDDVWVYIDDVLFLDLSGIHRHVGGKIDFVNGIVSYYELDPENGGDVSSTPYKEYSFAALFREAGWSEAEIDEVLKPMENYNRPFKDYTTHTFNFYYLERGSGSSVCRINFNFPLLKKNSISVTKENITVDAAGNTTSATVIGNPDYYFNIVNSDNELFVGPGSVTGITQYKIMESNGNIVKDANGANKLYTTDAYGIFTLKAGQTAIFEGIEENEGKYYVQELVKAEDNAQYPTVKINNQDTRYNKLIDWQYRKYFSGVSTPNASNPMYTGPYGYQWYGRSGYETDAGSSSSFYFEQQNHVNIAALGSLSVTKDLIQYVAPLALTDYQMHVELDGVPLRENTVYTVGGVTKTVTQAGIIEIAAGETALINNVISGTHFKIWEDSQSAQGYTVTYTQTGADEVSTDTENTYISGVVRTGAAVSVTITNSEGGTQVTIPGTKTVINPDGTLRSYTFTMVQVTDSTGASPVDGVIEYKASAEDTDSTVKDFSFTLTYLLPDIDSLPAQFYYRITEDENADAAVLANTTTYVAEVTVHEDGTASLTKMWKDGVEIILAQDEIYSADFVNTLVGELKLSKIVSGIETDHGFRFTVTLTPGTSGVPIANAYPVVVVQQNGEVDSAYPTWSFTDGTAVFAGFKDGESVTIQNIPIGTQWTITEDSSFADGYTPTYTVTQGGTEKTGEGWTSSGTISTGETNIVYTNTIGYELPETGSRAMDWRAIGFGLLLTLPILYAAKRRYRGRRVSGG